MFKQIYIHSGDLTTFPINSAALIIVAHKCKTSELDFHIWNANWQMKSEVKMAAYEGQICTSVLVSHATFYFSWKFSLLKIHTKHVIKR